MLETVHTWLSDAKKTRLAGSSLCKTIYTYPLTLLLQGELGAGKTTFLQGFAQGLGIEEDVTSPTYALEQRYQTRNAGEFMHIDLYRLKENDAKALMQSSDDHRGIRCIEWPEKAGDLLLTRTEPTIRIHLRDEKDGRQLEVSFDDIALPSDAWIAEKRREVMLPLHVQKHCDAVGAFAKRIGESLLERGILCRPQTLEIAGKVHDLFRFIDFRPGAGPNGADENLSDEERATWDKWKQTFAGMNHEEAVATYLKDEGFPELAQIVLPHGVRLPPSGRTTIEQKILYYSDKRLNGDRIVSLEERFDDFRMRYGNGKQSDDAKIWFAQAKDVEQELFPDGHPLS